MILGATLFLPPSGPAVASGFGRSASPTTSPPVVAPRRATAIAASTPRRGSLRDDPDAWKLFSSPCAALRCPATRIGTGGLSSLVARDGQRERQGSSALASSTAVAARAFEVMPSLLFSPLQVETWRTSRGSSPRVLVTSRHVRRARQAGVEGSRDEPGQSQRPSRGAAPRSGSRPGPSPLPTRASSDPPRRRRAEETRGETRLAVAVRSVAPAARRSGAALRLPGCFRSLARGGTLRSSTGDRLHQRRAGGSETSPFATSPIAARIPQLR